MHVPCYYNFLRGISRIPFRPTNCLSFFSAINLNMCGNRMHFKIHPDNWNMFTSLLQSPREQDSNNELPNVSVSQFSNEYNRKKKINSKMLLRIEQDIQAGIDLWHGEAYANVRF